jgi:large subunit ribosomal protein L6
VSRIGRKPVAIASGVKIQKTDHRLKVAGPKGELSAAVHADIGIEIKDNQVLVTRSSDAKEHRALRHCTGSGGHSSRTWSRV